METEDATQQLESQMQSQGLVNAKTSLNQIDQLPILTLPFSTMAPQKVLINQIGSDGIDQFSYELINKDLNDKSPTTAYLKSDTPAQTGGKAVNVQTVKSGTASSSNKYGKEKNSFKVQSIAKSGTGSYAQQNRAISVVSNKSNRIQDDALQSLQINAKTIKSPHDASRQATTPQSNKSSIPTSSQKRSRTPNTNMGFNFGKNKLIQMNEPVPILYLKALQAETIKSRGKSRRNDQRQVISVTQQQRAETVSPKHHNVSPRMSTRSNQPTPRMSLQQQQEEFQKQKWENWQKMKFSNLEKFKRFQQLSEEYSYQQYQNLEVTAQRKPADKNKGSMPTSSSGQKSAELSVDLNLKKDELQQFQQQYQEYMQMMQSKPLITPRDNSLEAKSRERSPRGNKNSPRNKFSGLSVPETVVGPSKKQLTVDGIPKGPITTQIKPTSKAQSRETVINIDNQNIININTGTQVSKKARKGNTPKAQDQHNQQHARQALEAFMMNETNNGEILSKKGAKMQTITSQGIESAFISHDINSGHNYAKNRTLSACSNSKHQMNGVQGVQTLSQEPISRAIDGSPSPSPLQHTRVDRLSASSNPEELQEIGIGPQVMATRIESGGAQISVSKEQTQQQIIRMNYVPPQTAETHTTRGGRTSSQMRMSPDTIKKDNSNLNSQKSPAENVKNLNKNNITLAIVSQESLENNSRKQPSPKINVVKTEMLSLNLDKIKPKIIPSKFVKQVNQQIINVKENQSHANYNIIDDQFIKQQIQLKLPSKQNQDRQAIQYNISHQVQVSKKPGNQFHISKNSLHGLLANNMGYVIVDGQNGQKVATNASLNEIFDATSLSAGESTNLRPQYFGQSPNTQFIQNKTPMNIESASYTSNKKYPLGSQYVQSKNTAIQIGSVNMKTAMPPARNNSNQNGSNYMNYSMYSLDNGHLQQANFNNSPEYSPGTRQNTSKLSSQPNHPENSQIEKISIPTDKDITIAAMKSEAVDKESQAQTQTSQQDNKVQIRSFLAPLGTLPQDARYIRALKTMNEANQIKASKNSGPILTDRAHSNNNSPKNSVNQQLSFEPQKVSIFLKKNSKCKTPFQVQDGSINKQLFLKERSIQQKYQTLEGVNLEVPPATADNVRFGMRRLTQLNKIDEFSIAQTFNTSKASHRGQSPRDTLNTARKEFNRQFNQTTLIPKSRQLNNTSEILKIFRKCNKEFIPPGKLEEWPTDQTPTPATTKGIMRPEWQGFVYNQSLARNGLKGIKKYGERKRSQPTAQVSSNTSDRQYRMFASVQRSRPNVEPIFTNEAIINHSQQKQRPKINNDQKNLTANQSEETSLQENGQFSFVIGGHHATLPGFAHKEEKNLQIVTDTFDTQIPTQQVSERDRASPREHSNVVTLAGDQSPRTVMTHSTIQTAKVSNQQSPRNIIQINSNSKQKEPFGEKNLKVDYKFKILNNGKVWSKKEKKQEPQNNIKTLGETIQLTKRSSVEYDRDPISTLQKNMADASAAAHFSPAHSGASPCSRRSASQTFALDPNQKKQAVPLFSQKFDQIIKDQINLNDTPTRKIETPSKKNSLQIGERDLNIAIIDNIVSDTQIDNLKGSKLRKTATADSADENEGKQTPEKHQDKKLATRVVSIKHKRQLSPLNNVIKKSGHTIGQSGTISDAMDELSHGAFAPFTSRDGIDGGLNKVNDRRGSSFVPQMLGVKIYESRGANLQFNQKQSMDLMDVMPVAIKNQNFDTTSFQSPNRINNQGMAKKGTKRVQGIRGNPNKDRTVVTTKDGRKVTQSLVRPLVLFEVAQCQFLDKIVDQGRSPRISTKGFKNGVIGKHDISLDGTQVTKINDNITSPKTNESPRLAQNKLSSRILNEIQSRDVKDTPRQQTRSIIASRAIAGSSKNSYQQVSKLSVNHDALINKRVVMSPRFGEINMQKVSQRHSPSEIVTHVKRRELVQNASTKSAKAFSSIESPQKSQNMPDNSSQMAKITDKRNTKDFPHSQEVFKRQPKQKSSDKLAQDIVHTLNSQNMSQQREKDKDKNGPMSENNTNPISPMSQKSLEYWEESNVQDGSNEKPPDKDMGKQIKTKQIFMEKKEDGHSTKELDSKVSSPAQSAKEAQVRTPRQNVFLQSNRRSQQPGPPKIQGNEMKIQTANTSKTKISGEKSPNKTVGDKTSDITITKLLPTNMKTVSNQKTSELVDSEIDPQNAPILELRYSIELSQKQITEKDINPSAKTQTFAFPQTDLKEQSFQSNTSYRAKSRAYEKVDRKRSPRLNYYQGEKEFIDELITNQNGSPNWRISELKAKNKTLPNDKHMPQPQNYKYVGLSDSLNDNLTFDLTNKQINYNYM